jgi:hypothetical protein
MPKKKTQSPSAQKEFSIFERCEILVPLHKKLMWKTWCLFNRQSFSRMTEYLWDVHLGLTPSEPQQITEDNSVLDFYVRLTGNKISPNDLTAYEEIKSINPLMVKYSMILTRSRAKNKINSFRYFLPGIEADSQTELSGELLRFLINRYERTIK